MSHHDHVWNTEGLRPTCACGVIGRQPSAFGCYRRIVALVCFSCKGEATRSLLLKTTERYFCSSCEMTNMSSQSLKKLRRGLSVRTARGIE